MGFSFASLCRGLKIAGLEIAAATMTRLISLPVFVSTGRSPSVPSALQVKGRFNCTPEQGPSDHCHR